MKNLISKYSNKNLLITLSLLVCITLLTVCSDEETLPFNPDGVRFNETVFSDLKISRDLSYGINTTQGGVSKGLLMDVYEPFRDTSAIRPLVILIHGGGFTGGDKDDFEELARYLARSGYVAVSIAYRLLDIQRTDENIPQAVIEAVFDAKAAVRFFKRDATEDNTYKVDTNNVFVGGYSAGAFTALHYAYLSDENEVDSVGVTGLLDYVQAHGGIEGDSGNPGYSSSIKGVFNIAGALLNTNLIDSNEPILFSVHGTEDQVVPFFNGTADGTGVVVEGSGNIHPVMNNLGIKNTLITIEGGDHGAFFGCDACEQELRAFIFENL